MADAKPKTRGDARVLVVEDADAIRAAVESGLVGAGHHVVARPDGRDFERILAEFQPDLVITDIMMPYLSGLEVIGAVKKKYPTGTPVIILSGMGQENVVLEAFQLGADDYITKPFSPNELSVRVRRFDGSTVKH